MNYYSHHIGDYRRDTAHLSLLEHGVYRQLLDMYYLSEEKIPKETESVYRRLCAKTDEEKKAVNTVLSEFFSPKDGWIHTRCDKEISAYRAKANRAKENGKLGGRPLKTKGVISGNPEETISQANHKPLTINHKPSKHTADYSAEFLEAWTAYPKRSGANKKAAYKAWTARIKAGAKAEDILSGVLRYASYCLANTTDENFIKQAVTFFGPDDHFSSDWTVSPSAPAKKAGPAWYTSDALTLAEGLKCEPPLSPHIGEYMAAFKGRVQAAIDNGYKVPPPVRSVVMEFSEEVPKTAIPKRISMVEELKKMRSHQK